MIELIIDAVKLVFSEDARKSASGLMDFIRRSPDWQKDICTLEAKVNADSQEHAYLLGELAVDKMTNLAFSPDSEVSFNSVYRELTANAFEHGCKANPDAPITIVIEITRHYVALTVSNPRGSRFDFASLLEAERTNLKNNPLSPRGRGLVTSSESADLLTATKSGEGLKALFYNPAVELKINRIGDVGIIHVLGGFANPSLNRRINSLAEQYQECDLIVDMARRPIQDADSRKRAAQYKRDDAGEFDTARITHSLELQERLAARGKRVAYLLRDARIKPPAGILPASLWTSSVLGALTLIGKLHLQSQFEKVISRLGRSPPS